MIQWFQWCSDSNDGNISKEALNTNLKGYMHPRVYYSVIHHTQDLKPAKVLISWWVDKKVVHLHKGILLSCKKERSLTLCNRMDGPGEQYAKWNKPEKDKYHMIYSYVESNEQTEQTRKMGTDS